MRAAVNQPTLRDDSHGVTPLNRVERKKREKLRAIKRAARELFARKGFASTKTREIAERADIGAGTLFLYTSSKEELLVEIFLEELGRTLDAAFASMPQSRPLLGQLLHIFNSVIRYHEPDPELARVFVKEMTFVDERLKERTAVFLRDWYARLAAVIERAQARGELPEDVPAFALARNCFALYIFTLETWLTGDHPRSDCESRLRESLGLHLRCAVGPQAQARAKKTPRPAPGRGEAPAGRAREHQAVNRTSREPTAEAGAGMEPSRKRQWAREPAKNS
jgi:AcrR family transcriptional regulator